MIEVKLVGPEAADEVLAVVHAAFGDRPVLDPPGDALAETRESIARALGQDGGLIALVDGELAGALVLDRQQDWLWLRRVGVLARFRGAGAAHALVAAAEQHAAGCRGLRLIAREELPQTVQFWKSVGYFVIARRSPYLEMAKLAPTTIMLPDLEATQALGVKLAGLVQPGDVVILTGGLGAGKTTLTKSLGLAMGVRGEVTSPTFVIARVHPGPTPLVHVDAYRLGGAAELDDLDLDTDLDDAVTVIEWGAGLAEALSSDRLEISLDVDPDTEARTATLTPIGARWAKVSL
ncbi:MAG: tRNA (adenosine(37)-N6)-threonylcarbamoyltransferase complex ATPase subunit type 1 TsaE [Marmoricola sp.]